MRWLVVLLVACHTTTAPPTTLPRDGHLLDNGAAFVPAERYLGKVVVLDFWAGWCEDCRKMAPSLGRLSDGFAPRGLVVVGVNVGERVEDATRYAHDMGITYPIAFDPDLGYSDRVGASELPMLLVIDRTGTIVHRSRHLDEETLGVIRKVLE